MKLVSLYYPRGGKNSLSNLCPGERIINNKKTGGKDSPYLRKTTGKSCIKVHIWGKVSVKKRQKKNKMASGKRRREKTSTGLEGRRTRGGLWLGGVRTPDKRLLMDSGGTSKKHQ